jgi:hypothetical protein
MRTHITPAGGELPDPHPDADVERLLWLSDHVEPATAEDIRTVVRRIAARLTAGAAATRRAEEAAGGELLEAVEDMFNQFAGQDGGEWPLSDDCLSALEDTADLLIRLGRLERHPERKRLYRWVATPAAPGAARTPTPAAGDEP